MIAWRYRLERRDGSGDRAASGGRHGAAPEGAGPRRGRSLEQELREILAAAARQDMAEFKAQAALIRARYQGMPQTDSVLLLREDRDR
jgi:hypothetical protein